MKKIVALVLCLALALSLCTVAFAASLTEVKTGVLENTSISASGWDVEVKYAADEDDDYGIRYQILEKVGGKWTNWAGAMVETDLNGADYKFVDGNDVTYLRKAVKYSQKATVVNTVDYEDADACGEAFHTEDEVIYKGADDGKYYISATAGTELLYVGGKTINATVVTPTYKTIDELEAALKTKALTKGFYVIAHTIEFETEENNLDKDYLTEVTCSECKANLAFETKLDKAIATFGSGNYVDYYVDVTVEDKDDLTTMGYSHLYLKSVIGTSAAGTAGDKTETVESAKTFDAGIALYAGMALASVAGSAVVIGKKKEF